MPATMLNGRPMYDDLDEFLAARRAWEDAHPNPTPQEQSLAPEASPAAMRENQLRAAGASASIPGAPELLDSLRRLQAQPPMANPYNLDAANASVSAQEALLSQMRAAQQGPSLAAMQGQQGLSQLGQQGLMRGGRAGLLGIQGAAGGMAADIGRARLAEAMKLQAGVGSTAGGVIGRGLTAQEQYQQSGLKARGISQDFQTSLNALKSQLQQAQGAAAIARRGLGEDLKSKAKQDVKDKFNAAAKASPFLSWLAPVGEALADTQDVYNK